MKKTFTYSMAIACTLLGIQKTFAQTCGPVTTTAPAGVSFTTTLPVSSAQGFSSSNQTTVGTFPSNSTTELTSPILFYTTTQNTIYFRYTLQSENPGTTAVPTISILFGSPLQTISCTGSSFPISNTATTYYFSITPATPFTSPRNFQIRLALAIPSTINGGRQVTATEFSTNALLAPAGAALPVNFTAIAARKKGSGVEISWDVAGETEVVTYEVQRSANARDYTTIGEVTATGSNSYSFIDNKPSNGISFYRVRNVDVDGNYKYTIIVRVNLNRVIELKAYPLPAKDEVTIEHAIASKGILTLATATGQVVKTIQVKPDVNQTSINIAALNKGFYLVRFTTGEGSTESLRIVKQ